MVATCSVARRSLRLDVPGRDNRAGFSPRREARSRGRAVAAGWRLRTPVSVKIAIELRRALFCLLSLSIHTTVLKEGASPPFFLAVKQPRWGRTCPHRITPLETRAAVQRPACHHSHVGIAGDHSRLSHVAV